MEKYGFVYIWRDKKHNRYYIGSHWGTESDGYICSSFWLKQAYKLRPQDFKRRIIERIPERKNLNEAEHRWLQMINENELGKRYYNLRNHRFGHWSSNPEKVQSIRERNLGENNPMYGKTTWMKGKTHTEEAKAIIREKRKLQTFSEERNAKISAANKGRKFPYYPKGPMSEETKRKISEAQKGKPREYAKGNTYGRWCKGRPATLGMTGKKHSEETKEKMRIARQMRIP